MYGGTSVMIHTTSWPYANETGITKKLSCDVLVLGDGLAGWKELNQAIAKAMQNYYCGACVMACPRPGAISLNHPLRNHAKFVPIISQ